MLYNFFSVENIEIVQICLKLQFEINPGQCQGQNDCHDLRLSVGLILTSKGEIQNYDSVCACVCVYKIFYKGIDV